MNEKGKYILYSMLIKETNGGNRISYSVFLISSRPQDLRMRRPYSPLYMINIFHHRLYLLQMIKCLSLCCRRWMSAKKNIKRKCTKAVFFFSTPVQIHFQHVTPLRRGQIIKFIAHTLLLSRLFFVSFLNLSHIKTCKRNFMVP